MLNLDTKVTPMYTVKLMEHKDSYQIISKVEKDRIKKFIVMTYLTEDEENQIDNGKTINIVRNKRKFSIQAKDCLCYGEIDFHLGSDDSKIISNFKWLSHLVFCGVWVPSNYDYDTHTTTSDRKTGRWYDTMRPEVVCRYYHGILGKPKRTLIFRYTEK